MNWSSVKNLLIAILLAANVFLVYNIVRQDRVRRFLDEDTVKDAVAFLAEKGLDVELDNVPLEIFNAQVYESAFNDEYYTKVADTVFAAGRELVLSLPNGGFSITSADGAYLEFDSEFGFFCSLNDNFKNIAYIDITSDNIAKYISEGEEIKGSDKKRLRSETERFLSPRFESNYTASIDASWCFRDPLTGLDYVLAYQEIDGYRICNHYAVCVFDEEAMIGAYGRWFFAGFKDVHSAELTDQINVLFADMEVLKSDYEDASGGTSEVGQSDNPPSGTTFARVETMKACYATYWNADKTSLYFIPAWQVGHSDGLKVVFNATNGTVYSKYQ